MDGGSQRGGDAHGGWRKELAGSDIESSAESPAGYPVDLLPSRSEAWLADRHRPDNQAGFDCLCRHKRWWQIVVDRKDGHQGSSPENVLPYITDRIWRRCQRDDRKERRWRGDM